MQKVNLADLSTEELRKKIKSLKIMMGILAGSGIVILVAGIFLYVTAGKFPLGLISLIALIPLVPTYMKSIKDMEAELQRRG